MIIENDELYHYGVKGMKWGIRRYENYDGTYTQAGLKRYKSAKEEYNKAAKKAAKAYRNDKANYKDYKKIEKQKAKDVWAARRNLKKAYDIDVGKELYSNGKRIRSNNAQLQIAASAALLTMYGARKIGNISKNERRAIDIGAAVAYGAYTIHLQSQNNKLKKYYGRTKK